MQDLARLFVAPIVVFLALIARQHAQRIDGQLRVERQRLIGGNDRVSSEDGGEPGNTGGDDVLIALGDLQGVEVADGGFQQAIKHIIVRLETGGAGLPASEVRAPLPQLMIEIIHLRARGLPLDQGVTDSSSSTRFRGSSRRSQRATRSWISVGAGVSLISVCRMMPSSPR